MKLSIIILSIILLTITSCSSNQKTTNRHTVNGIYYSDYTDYTVAHCNSLTSPVIIIGKVKSMGSYNITIKDSTGIIKTYGNRSYFADNIGASREIGDTIR